MDTKLTLKLNKNIIEKAKKYAQEHNQSLSMLVENYFRFLAGEEKNSQTELSPTVRELAGIISLEENYDHKKEYQEFLQEKYK